MTPARRCCGNGGVLDRLAYAREHLANVLDSGFTTRCDRGGSGVDQRAGHGGRSEQLLEARQDAFASVETDRVFQELARQYRGDPEKVRLLEIHHAIVRDAREHGIDRAFAPYATPPSVEAVYAELMKRLAIIASELEFLTMFSREPHLRRRLLEIVGEFVNAATYAGKRAALERHASILLTPGAEWFFGSDAVAGDATFGVHLQLLRAVREHGVSAAFELARARGPEGLHPQRTSGS